MYPLLIWKPLSHILIVALTLMLEGDTEYNAFDQRLRTVAICFHLFHDAVDDT